MASQVESLKYVPGTEFNVDGFRFVRPGTRHFFLTHFHGDHTVGLTRDFNHGTIYCSAVTARLLIRDFGLRGAVVCPLTPHVPVDIAGVRVTPLPANHCPGALLFLFQVPHGNGAGRVDAAGENTPAAPAGTPLGAAESKLLAKNECPAFDPGAHTTVLHTGDMRWSEDMLAYPALRALPSLDVLVLDTTYCSPRWRFPPQHQVLASAVDWVVRERQRLGGARMLCVANSYHIGKEKFYFGLAEALGCRVWACPAKRRVLSWLDLPREWLQRLTDDPLAADVHVLSAGERLTPAALAARLDGPGAPWAAVAGFRATGWSFRGRGAGASADRGCLGVWRDGAAAVIGAPYSEHSSWDDLRACVAALRPRRIIPSVNAADPAKARALVDCFADLMDLRRDRSRLHAYFNIVRQGIKTLLPGGARLKLELAEASGGDLRDSLAVVPVVKLESKEAAHVVNVEPSAPIVKLEPAPATCQAAVMVGVSSHADTDTDASSSDWNSSPTLVATEKNSSPLLPLPDPLTSPPHQDTVVDLGSIDRDEQVRLWNQITTCSRKRTGAPATLRQDNLKRFFRATSGGGDLA